jgi:lysophospholipase L1-like esterase
VGGYPYGEPRVISHYLDEALERQYPGDYAVTNLGVPCKGSIYVRNCVERIIETRPEMLVVYTGHNDFSGLMSKSPRLQMWLGEHGWWLAQIRRWLANTRAWSIIDGDRSARELATNLDPMASLDAAEIDKANRIILAAYEENLEKILEMARRHGTQVLWVTPVGNLHDFPNARGTGGWVYALSRARKTDPRPTDWEIAYAKGIEAFGRQDFAESIQHFKAARDLAPETRAPTLLNERLRELDEQHPDLNLIDFEAELDEAGLEEGIGCNFFGSEEYCDGVHPNPRTTRLIAEAIARRIAEIRQGQP